MSHDRTIDFPKLENSREIEAYLAAMVQGIRFGSIEIVIHDGRIVQIDKHEKFRVKPQPNTH
ncbi:MAG: YezD family protein [Gammaproteobacteria bacterium]